MKLFSRDFTLPERLLILALTCLLLGAAYHYLVDLPLNRTITELEARRDDLEVTVNNQSLRLSRLESMQESLDTIRAYSTVGILGIYDNKKEELDFLNGVLSEADSYTLSIQGVTRQEDLIRRAFSLQYMTTDYEKAVRIIDELSCSSMRCLVEDIQMSTQSVTFQEGPVTVSVSAIFYETMAGAESTAGIPVS